MAPAILLSLSPPRISTLAQPTQYGSIMALCSAGGLAVAIALATAYVALHAYLCATQHPREPQLIETSIPFLTPLVRLMDNRYFLKLR
jgi:hypothetical protein